MKIYTHDEMLNEVIGEKGTPRRDRYDADVRRGVTAYRLGEVLKEERQRQKLTQRQLGELAGVTESIISKVENGHTASFFSIDGILQALGISATFDMGRLGRVALT